MRKWIVRDGEVVEAAYYTEGTDYVQFWRDGKEIAVIPSSISFTEVVDGETELLAEVRPEGEADVPVPTWASDADAKPRKPSRKVSRRKGKVPRVRPVAVHADDSGYVDEQPDSETAPSV